MEKKALECEIAVMLRLIGVQPDVRGWRYIVDAVKMVVEDEGLLYAITKELYPAVARRYARASGIAPAAFVGFSPFPSPPPPLAQLASWPGRKACAPAPRLPVPPSGLGLPGTPGQASAGGPFSRLPPSHFLVSVAVGSSGATPPPPPRRPVSPAAIKAEWGGLVGAASGPPPAPLGPSGALQPRPPFWGPGAGLFLVSLRRE